MSHESRFHCEAQDHEAGITVFRIAGRFYGTKESYAFQEQAAARVKAKPHAVVIDMSGVERIDSCGVGILAAILVSTRNAMGRLVLVGVPPHAERVLEAAWLLVLCESAGSVGEAVARLVHGVRNVGPAS